MGISKKLFYKQYTITEKLDVGGFYITVVTGYKNVDRLKDKLYQHGAIFMKTDEVVELPQQVEQIIKIPNTTQYRKFNQDRVITIDDEMLVGDTALTKLLYLRQLASIYNQHKQQALKDLLASTHDRVIVFYNFKKEYQLIKKLAEELEKPASHINGDGTDLETTTQRTTASL